MDQIISLLTNLFSLTKVASVTLPGLLTAGGLALILWPAVPIDVLPVVTKIDPPSQNESSHVTAPSVDRNKSCAPAHSCYADFLNFTTFPPPGIEACRVEHPLAKPLVDWIEDPSKFAPVNFPSEHSSLGSELKQELLSITSQVATLDVPASRRDKIVEQYVLDVESRNVAKCIDLEKSWQGQEEKDAAQLSADADILEKQRSAAQDNYLTYLKANDPLEYRYKAAMAEVESKILAVRGMIRDRNFDTAVRTLHLAKLSKDQQLIEERLGDPGRLRPRVGFDVFVTGLVTHIVGFILLSLAAAIVVTAFDRAVFGAFFEDLFDGF